MIDQQNITTWHEYKLNYWGITKNANTSVKLCLSNKSKNLKEKNSYSSIHSPGKSIEYIDISTALTNGFTNFTVVRDPARRVISMYKDITIKRYNKLSLAKKFNIEKNITLDSFLEFLEDNMDKNIHFSPQSSFISRDNKLLPEKIFRQENMKELESFLGLSIPITNSTKTVKKYLSLTEEQTSKIYKLYQKDYELLNYVP